MRNTQEEAERATALHDRLAPIGVTYVWGNKHACGTVEPGWHDLVVEALTKAKAAGWSGELIQIKEKFGGLRIYTRGCPEEAAAFIQEAQVDALTLCETCGASEEVTTTSGKRRWIKTLCHRCREAYEARE